MSEEIKERVTNRLKDTGLSKIQIDRIVDETIEEIERRENEELAKSVAGTK